MMQKTLIRNGRVVTAVDDYVGDILLEGGRIEAIGRSLDVEDAEVHDATDHLVMPGGVDVHVHMETPMGNGIETCDSFESVLMPSCSSSLPSSSFSGQLGGGCQPTHDSHATDDLQTNAQSSRP